MEFNPDGTPKDGSGFSTPGNGAPPAPNTPGTGDNGQTWNPTGGPDGQGAWEQGPSGPGFGANGWAKGVDYNPRTGANSFGENPQLGDIGDPRAWGGISGKVIIGPDGKPMVDPSQSGRARDVGRFQKTGEDAANRAAFQMDYGKGDIDRGNAQATRAQQGVATAMLAQAAKGGAPSAAVIRGQGATDDSFASMLGAQAGARGGPANQAAATQGGAAASRGQQLGVASMLGGARSNELTGARGAYSTGANTMRGGDYQQQALDQQRERARMNNQLTQDELNQRRQLGYEGLAYDVNRSSMEQGLHDQERDAGAKITESNRDTRQQDRIADFYSKSVNDINKSNPGNTPPGGG